MEPDGGWVLVLPDPADAVTRLWAEGADADTAQALLDEWAAVVERAGKWHERAGTVTREAKRVAQKWPVRAWRLVRNA